MKITLLLFLLSVTASLCAAQYTTKTVLSEQHFVVNSKTHPGGMSRVPLAINLPENTVSWCYRYSCYRNKADIEAVSKRTSLAVDLGLALVGIPPGAISSVRQAVKSLAVPPGGDYCDVYLMNRQGYDAFRNPFGNWTYYPEASRENFESGLVEVHSVGLQGGEYYLGFRNSSMLYGVHVIVSVEAVVDESQNKTALYGSSSTSQVSQLSRNLIGTWKDENSTFTLSREGTVLLRFDGKPDWLSGQWSVLEGGILYMTIGNQSTAYQLLVSGPNQFSYRDQKRGTLYRATRLAD